jgi:anti-sigma regulatory factor (Ser/Thr protein kinase)
MGEETAMMVRAMTESRRDSCFRMSVPGLLDQRPLAIQFVVSVCRAYSVPLDIEHAVLSAFSEAFNNVVLHSYRDGEGDVDVEVEIERGRLTLRLRDRGVGFDPSAVRAPQLEALPENGLGLFIILRAMDDVRWLREDDQNVLVMAKRLPRTTIY